jgi:HCO3- transporter family
MPIKHQPDHIFLRHVKAARVHAFTAIQVVCSILMWVIKSIKITSIAFPIMVTTPCVFQTKISKNLTDRNIDRIYIFLNRMVSYVYGCCYLIFWLEIIVLSCARRMHTISKYLCIYIGICADVSRENWQKFISKRI